MVCQSADFEGNYLAGKCVGKKLIDLVAKENWKLVAVLPLPLGSFGGSYGSNGQGAGTFEIRGGYSRNEDLKQDPVAVFYLTK